jgi:hypothetical protein
VKCQTKEAALTARDYLGPNVEKHRGRRGAGPEDANDPCLLLDEQAIRTIASVPDEDGTGQTARYNGNELDRGKERKRQEKRRDGDEAAQDKEFSHRAAWMMPDRLREIIQGSGNANSTAVARGSRFRLLKLASSASPAQTAGRDYRSAGVGMPIQRCN